MDGSEGKIPQYYTVDHPAKDKNGQDLWDPANEDVMVLSLKGWLTYIGLVDLDLNNDKYEINGPWG